MFNSILKNLNGHAAETDSLTEAFAQLGRDRESARAEIDRLNQERRQALLDDATDSVLDKLERSIDRATVRLEKLNIAEAPLRERLTAAAAEARKKAEPSLVEEYHEAFMAYCAALEEISKAHRLQTEIRERARGILGDGRAAILLPAFAYAGVLTHEHISMWIDRNRDELEESIAMIRAKVAPAASASIVEPKRPVARTRLPHERARGTDSQRPIYLGLEQSGPKHKSRALDDLSPLEPGQVRAVVINAGFPHPITGDSCRAGLNIRLPLEIAQKAARSGSIEILNEGDRA